MYLLRLLGVALAIFAAGCGREGLRLLDSDASVSDAAIYAPLEAGVASDAGPPDAAVMDAGPRPDASVDASQPIDASTPPPCGGHRLFDICWYLATEDTSCNDFCSTHGGYAPGSSSRVGTSAEGGSASSCSAILGAVLAPGTVRVSRRTDGYGLGCHVWSDGAYYWLDDPSFDPRDSPPRGSRVRIACGCQR